MTEQLWFVLIFWIIFVVLGLKFKNQYFTSVSALVGIFLGFVSLTEVYVWFGLIIIFTSIYLLYSAMFRTAQSKGAKKKNR
jgi:hypothetical protein